MNKWDYYCIKKIENSVRRRIFKQNTEHYAGRKIMNSEAAAALISKKIMEGVPFAASRFGSTECSAICRREAIKRHRFLPNYDMHMHELSGFFPCSDEMLWKFHDMMVGMIPDIDLLGIWHPSMEEFIIDEYMPDTELTRLRDVGPILSSSGWNCYLKDKKVLVIHPFEASIKSQYSRRELLFEDERILPRFELKTIKAVQTIAGNVDERFNDWFEAYDYMKRQMNETDFDVALIGCGSYGMPLAIEAKRMGKTAIHCGGSLQLLFGIKGARWDKSIGPDVYNKYWIRPLPEDNVLGQQKVEGGCYW